MTGCTFSPHNEYVSPIEPPKDIYFTIEINDENFTDPYNLVYPTRFDFTLQETSKPITNQIVLVNRTPVSSSLNGKTISFTLSPGSYPDGRSEVVIQVQFDTNSGSLADRMGTEYYLLEKKITLITDRTPPPDIPTPTLAYEKGFLTMRWTPTTKQNFVYMIKRNSYWKDSIITNPGQSYFADPIFMGGKIKYTLMASGLGFDKALGTVEFDQAPIDWKVEISDKRIAHLSWKDVLIDTANTKIRITSYKDKLLPLTRSAVFEMDTLKLGDQLYYNIEIFREKYPNIKYQDYRLVRLLPNLKPFGDVVMLPKHQKILLVTSNKIYRYSIPDFVLEDSLIAQGINYYNFRRTSLAVKPDESAAYAIFNSGGITRFDPLNFSDQRNYNLFSSTIEMTGSNQEIDHIALGNVTNEGLITLSLTKVTTWSLVYDLNLEKVIWNSAYYTGFPTVLAPVISGDGKIVAFDNPNSLTAQVLKNAGGSFEISGEIDKGQKFFLNDKNELINIPHLGSYPSIKENKIVSIYNLDLSPQKTRTLEIQPNRGEQYLMGISYDVITRSLYTRYDDITGYANIDLITLDNFNSYKKLKAKSYGYTGVHFYCNGYLMINSGFIEQVK